MDNWGRQIDEGVWQDWGQPQKENVAQEVASLLLNLFPKAGQALRPDSSCQLTAQQPRDPIAAAGADCADGCDQAMPFLQMLSSSKALAHELYIAVISKQMVPHHCTLCCQYGKALGMNIFKIEGPCKWPVALLRRRELDSVEESTNPETL